LATDFLSLKDAQADLALAPLNLTVLLAPYSATPAETLEGADGALDVPAEYQSVGHFQKQAGLSLMTDMSSQDIEAYGESDPIRNIISRKKTSFDFVMFENKRLVLEVIHSADFSDVTPSANGGIVLQAPTTPKNRYYRAALVGQDDHEEGEVWIYWLMPKVKLDKVDNQTLNDDNVLEYKPTLTAFKDDELGYSVAQGFCGPGWAAIADLAGFGTTKGASASESTAKKPVGGSTATAGGSTAGSSDTSGS
jgi:hypothetical protein